MATIIFGLAATWATSPVQLLQALTKESTRLLSATAADLGLRKDSTLDRNGFRAMRINGSAVSLVRPPAFLLLLLSSASIVYAQAPRSNNATITVQAVIAQGLSVTPSAGSDGLGNLNLGSAMRNSTAADVNPNSNPAAGLMTINGQAAMPLTISYTPSIQLIANGQAQSTLNFVPQIVGANSLNLQQAAAPLPSGSSISLSTDGHFYFWLGGLVDVPPGQAPGTYTGVFDITIGY